MKIEGKGERKVQVRQAVIDFFFCLCGAAVGFPCKNHWVPGGETTFRTQTVP